MIRASKNSPPRPRRKNRKAQPRRSTKRGRARRKMKYWEIIADNLSKAGRSWGCVAAIDSNGRTIWIADAQRDNGKRFVVRAHELLTAFLELESAIRAPLFEIARVLVHLDHYKKPHDSENHAAFIRHSRPRGLTTQPLRDQPHANCLCLRKKHARGRRV
jgi:hypothetical protein